MWNHFSWKAILGLLSKGEGDRNPGGVSLQPYGKREKPGEQQVHEETTYG